jgi:hypothetical protein
MMSEKPAVSLWQDYQYNKLSPLGMAVDLNSCIGWRLVRDWVPDGKHMP